MSAFAAAGCSLLVLAGAAAGRVDKDGSSLLAAVGRLELEPLPAGAWGAVTACPAASEPGAGGAGFGGDGDAAGCAGNGEDETASRCPAITGGAEEGEDDCGADAGGAGSGVLEVAAPESALFSLPDAPNHGALAAAGGAERLCRGCGSVLEAMDDLPAWGVMVRTISFPAAVTSYLPACCRSTTTRVTGGFD